MSAKYGIPSHFKPLRLLGSRSFAICSVDRRIRNSSVSFRKTLSYFPIRFSVDSMSLCEGRAAEERQEGCSRISFQPLIGRRQPTKT
jgi:hypothetical protein